MEYLPETQKQERHPLDFVLEQVSYSGRCNVAES
jgi:hypothetical protein